MKNVIDVCPIPMLGYQQCPTGRWSQKGKILYGRVIDFTPAVTEANWALGFQIMGKAFPYSVNPQQAYYFTSLLLYRCTEVDAVTAQFTDSYVRSSGTINTSFQVAFDHAGKKLTIGNLISQGRSCLEIEVDFWEATVFNFSTVPVNVTLPYTTA